MTFVVLDLDKVYDAKGVFPWSCIATCFLGQTSVWLRLSVVNFNWRAKKDKESNINNICVKDHIAKGRTRGLWRGDSWLVISSYFFFFSSNNLYVFSFLCALPSSISATAFFKLLVKEMLLMLNNLGKDKQSKLPFKWYELFFLSCISAIFVPQVPSTWIRLFSEQHIFSH